MVKFFQQTNSDAFLTAFTKLNTLEDTKLFGAWLKRIVVNKSIDYLKSKKSSKVGFKVEDGKKVRILKTSGEKY